MPNSDPLPSLLFKINENQLALVAAITELSHWVEQRGYVDVTENVGDALWAIDSNEEITKMSLTLSMTPADRFRPIAEIRHRPITTQSSQS